ncbi:hypothetical protein LCGC14_2412360 [marine sediment metagenome]|uniref:Uncharacterized protein n=1 Tax=marine sediment metagenome TaxID=412755 RepID=A0A0F9E4B3_9ZZZZ
MRTTFQIDVVLADNGKVYDSVRKSVDLSFVPAVGTRICYEGSGVDGREVVRAVFDFEILTSFITLAPDTASDEATAETLLAEHIRIGWRRVKTQAPMDAQHGVWIAPPVEVEEPEEHSAP